MSKKKVIISGTRSFTAYSYLEKHCDELLKGDEYIILSGKARGPDTLGEQYASERNFEVMEFPAKWNDIEDKPERELGHGYNGKYWKVAGFVRNEAMAEEGDMLIAFWNFRSSGTEHMIEQAVKKGLTTFVVPIP